MYTRPPASARWAETQWAIVCGTTQALREQLRAEAGLRGVEIVDPAEDGYAQRAARIFLRDGCAF